MTSKSCGDGRHRVGEALGHAKSSRELMQLILRDVILRKADAKERRVVIALTKAMLSSLLSPRRESTKIYLSDLRRLGEAQADSILAGMRYTSARRNSRATARRMHRGNREDGAPPSRTR